MNADPVYPIGTTWSAGLAVLVGTAAIIQLGMPQSSAEEPISQRVAQSSPGPTQQEDGSDFSDSNTVRSPELVAIGWQLVDGFVKEEERLVQSIWRPDGTLYSRAESERLQKVAQGFQLVQWDKKAELRPLVLLFQQDSKIITGIAPRICLPDREEFLSAGASGGDRGAGLTVSSLSPQRTDLSEWPDRIDIEIKVPLENWAVIKTLNEIPDEHVDVGPGFRWYISPDKGVNFANRESPVGGLTAAVLEKRGDQSKSLVNYDVRVWLKDEKQPVRRCYSTATRNAQGVNIEIGVSMPIEDASMIQKVEFLRQRYRFDRIKNVQTHPDLLPKGDQ